METARLEKQHSVSVMVEREAVVAFKEKMRDAGIDVQALQVAEVKPGLHESAEGITARPIYRVSWHKQPLRLLGLLSLPRTDGGSGRFVRISAQMIDMPPEASRRYNAAGSAAEVDESTIFLSTRLADSYLDAVLAVRVAKQWLLLYRWNASWAELGISRLDICSF